MTRTLFPDAVTILLMLLSSTPPCHAEIGSSSTLLVLVMHGKRMIRASRLIRRIGEVIQFFHAAADHCHYKMLGVFFLAEFSDEPDGQGEHDLFWLPLAEAERAFFHESHAWAARQGL